jgi:hypothetical protein
MKTSTGLSRLDIDCGHPARHPPLSEELFALSPPVLPASAHEIEEFMNAADEKRQLHQVMRARQLLNASLRAQVSGRPWLFATETSSCIGEQVSCALWENLTNNIKPNTLPFVSCQHCMSAMSTGK